MAHVASARKSIRQTERRTKVNRSRLTRVRTALRVVEDAIAVGDKAKARAAFQAAQPVLMHGASQGTIHHNTVSRRLSRLSARIKSL